MKSKIALEFVSALAILLFSFSAHAMFENSSMFGAIGQMNENLTRTTDSSSGKTDFFGSSNHMPIFFGMSFKGADGGFAAGGQWMPKIGYTILPEEDKDGATKISYLIVSIPVVKPIGASSFDYSIGTSYVRKMFKGGGGTVSGQNGGSPMTFYEGDHKSAAAYMTVDLGLGYTFQPFRLSTELLILSLLSDKRSYNLIVTLGYSFGG